MTFDERIQFYNENYDTVYCELFSTGRKRYIGTKGTCRFCGKSEPEVSFSNESHAIPEFLGNHTLILNEECDSCNRFFSETLEDHLDKYTKPFRTLAMIRGKKKIPTYRSRNHSDIRPKGRNELHVENPDILQIMEHDELNNSFSINFDFESHIPTAVYKSLVKIAISCIEDTSLLPQLEQPINWIMIPDHSLYLIKPLKMHMTVMPGPGVDATLVHLLKKKIDKSCISFVFMIYFGNLIYQIYFPSNADMAGRKSIEIQLPRHPSSLGESNKYGKFQHSVIDLTNHERIVKSEKITFTYSERVPVGLSTIDESKKVIPIDKYNKWYPRTNTALTKGNNMKTELWNIAMEIESARKKLVAMESKINAAIATNQAKPSSKLKFRKAVSNAASAMNEIGKIMGSIK